MRKVMAYTLGSALVTRTHTLDSDVVHYSWDNATPPKLTIEPGDTVVIKCRDSSDGHFRRGMTSADMKPRAVKGHPLTGPIAIRGARPGDVLQIDILELVPGDLGYTAFNPGRGLLPDDFPEPYLKMWDLDGVSAELRPGVRVPLEPFSRVADHAHALHEIIHPQRRNISGGSTRGQHV